MVTSFLRRTTRPHPRENVCEPDRGLTLVELLIVMALIGILATVAVPKFSQTKEKGFDAAAVSDIRRAMVAIESYYADNLSYPSTPADANFQPSPGVAFTTWKVQKKKGVPSVLLNAGHAQSSNFFEVRYPAQSDIERRSK